MFTPIPNRVDEGYGTDWLIKLREQKDQYIREII